MRAGRDSLLATGGPYCDLRTLFRLRAYAAGLQIQPPSRALSRLSGGLRSTMRGRGIEFEEVRAYASGDDVRSIDWRVTARTGAAHTRLFREERERPVYLLVDQRPAMFFGSRRTLKSVQAVHAAALLAWATLDGGDCIGGLVLGATEQREIRARRNRHAVLALLRLCHEFNTRLGLEHAARAGAPGTLSGAIASLRRIARPGSLAILISDFHDCDADATRQLHLLARHVEIAGVAVSDPLERELPAIGPVEVSDGQQRRVLDTADPRLRERHRTNFEAARAAVEREFRRLGTPFIEMPTDASALEVLGRYYRRRGAA